MSQSFTGLVGAAATIAIIGLGAPVAAAESTRGEPVEIFVAAPGETPPKADKRLVDALHAALVDALRDAGAVPLDPAQPGKSNLLITAKLAQLGDRLHVAVTLLDSKAHKAVHRFSGMVSAGEEASFKTVATEAAKELVGKARAYSTANPPGATANDLR